MKLGIMQPYFIPYIGYWQLINAVDKYVIYDDVNFIKGGWINRNRILMNGTAKLVSLQLQGASPNKCINEVELTSNAIYNEKLLKTLDICYRKAPYFKEVYPLIREIIMLPETNIARYLEYSIRKICLYLSIGTEIHVSSLIKKQNELRGQDKVIEICKMMDCDEYINAIGGRELYSTKEFENHGIQLAFLESVGIMYQQFNSDFIPNLSIIDVLMFNSIDRVKELLEKCQITKF